MTLKEIQEQYGIDTDKESSHHTYFDIYEKLFSDFYFRGSIHKLPAKNRSIFCS